MTATPDPGRQDEPTLGDALRRIGRIERHLMIVPADIGRACRPVVRITAPASKTERTIAMVMVQMIAGHDLSEVESFWVDKARQELDRRLDERERVLQSATKALTCRRMRSARARQLAIAVLTAAGHPAFADPVIAIVPIADDPGKAAS